MASSAVCPHVAVATDGASKNPAKGLATCRQCRQLLKADRQLVIDHSLALLDPAEPPTAAQVQRPVEPIPLAEMAGTSG
jgi:hypothetical protein